MYLTASKGATSHWFWGNIEELMPKPVLKRLKEAFSRLGISIDLLDRHFVAGENHILIIHLFNDFEKDIIVDVSCYLVQGKEKVYLANFRKHLMAQTHVQHELKIKWPEYRIGAAALICELKQEEQKIAIESRKPVILYRPDFWQTKQKVGKKTIILGANSELRAFLQQIGQDFEERLSESNLQEVKLVLIYGPAIQKLSKSERELLQNFVLCGGLLILQEPEINVNEGKSIKIFEDFKLNITWRKDPDRGGYDSVVFPEKPEHPLFEGLQFDDFKIWNGHLGGKIVEQYFVWPSRPAKVLASCNLGLRVPAVFEISYGLGKILVSRLLLKDRLINRNQKSDHYGRFDPVAVKYF